MPSDPVPDPMADDIVHSHPIAKVWNGGYPLPMVYWVWGWLGGLAWRILFAAVTPSGSDNPFASLLLVFALVVSAMAYQILVWVGIWRSASRYTGRKAWATLAQASVAIGVAFVVIGLVMSFSRGAK